MPDDHRHDFTTPITVVVASDCRSADGIFRCDCGYLFACPLTSDDRVC